MPSPIRAGVATPLALWFPLGIVVAVCWACSIDEGRSGRSVTVRSNALLLAAFVAAVVSSAVLALVPMALDASTSCRSYPRISEFPRQARG